MQSAIKRARDQSQPSVPKVGRKDIFAIRNLSIAWILSWLLPQTHWMPVAMRCAKVRERLREKEKVNQTSHIEAILGERSVGRSPEEMNRAHHANQFVERMQLMRWYRPGGWKFSWRVRGKETLDRIRDSGEGAVLWFAPSDYSTIVSKAAIHGSGVALHYLSHYGHNLTTTLWGSRVINPVRQHAENRYLAERLVIWPGTERDTFQALAERLAEGKIVGITVAATARRVHNVRFLEGRLRLATGPAALALRYGAPLVPVFTTREEDGGFTVTVGQPLEPDPDDDLQARIEKMLSGYAEQLQPFALSYPDQFPWKDVLLRDARG